MHITIKDQHLARRTLIDKPTRRIGQIIEHAIARAVVIMRMMRSARRVTGKPVSKREACCRQSAIGRQKGPVAQHITPVKPQNTQRAGRQRSLRHRVDIVRTVNRRQIGTCHWLRMVLVKAVQKPITLHDRHQPAEFRRRKPMPIGQRDIIGGVRDKAKHNRQLLK